MPEAQIKEMLGDVVASNNDVEIWPENLQIFDIFWRVKHQWHVVPFFGGVFYQALRYSAIESTLRLLKIEETPEIFDGLQIMEQAAKQVLNKE